MVYTPKNDKGERLKFDDKDVKFSSDFKDGRFRGLKGQVTINGKKYNVYGMDCSIPGCCCDDMIREE